MSVTNDGAKPKITFTAPKVEMEPYRLQGEEFADEFGVPASLIKSGGTILRDRNLNYVYIPVASLEELGKQVFDFPQIRKKFGEEYVIVFCFYTNETVDGKADLHARGLAPNVGVDEDPFTGSMQAGLVHAAKQNGLIPTDQADITTEQGHFVARPGFAVINHKDDSLTVTATAMRVFSTKLEL